MNERQKIVLQKAGEIGDVHLVPEFRESDMKDRAFTLEYAKQYPYEVDEYDFQLFTKPYVKQLMENAKIYFADQAKKGVYSTIDEYNVDFKTFEDMMLEKVAARQAYREDIKTIDGEIRSNESQFGRK